MLVKSDVDLYLVCSFPPTDAAVKTPYTLYGSCFGLVSGTVTGWIRLWEWHEHTYLKRQSLVYLDVEKSSLKMKNCPGVTFPSAMSFCTSRPCKRDSCSSLNWMSMELFQHTCHWLSEATGTEKEDWLVDFVQNQNAYCSVKICVSFSHMALVSVEDRNQWYHDVLYFCCQKKDEISCCNNRLIRWSQIGKINLRPYGEAIRPGGPWRMMNQMNKHSLKLVALAVHPGSHGHDIIGPGNLSQTSSYSTRQWV
jgi:hypothetical protein